MRNRREVIIAIVAVALYGACCALAMGQSAPAPAPAGAQTKETTQPRAVAPGTEEPLTAVRVVQQHGGSLLRASLVAEDEHSRTKVADVSFFAVPAPEPRKLRKHDLVTVILREQSEYSSQGTTDLKKQESLNAQLTEFIKVNWENGHLSGDAISSPIGVAGRADAQLKGEATVERNDSFIGRITAEILDVKPNGTVVLQARKRIKTDEEVQEFIVTGTCRAEDVTADNTVLSTQLHELELIKNHKGDVRRTTKKGWIPKLLDLLDPF